MAEQQFQESLLRSLHDTDDDKDQYLGRPPTSSMQLRLMLNTPGLSLRELIHEFKYQTLVLFKCCLLQPKVLDPSTIGHVAADR